MRKARFTDEQSVALLHEAEQSRAASLARQSVALASRARRFTAGGGSSVVYKSRRPDAKRLCGTLHQDRTDRLVSLRLDRDWGHSHEGSHGPPPAVDPPVFGLAPLL